ncbi:MAG: AmmeMemoRadiSam system radical SAM enzyme [Methanosarcinales archaeon Met12]|nr:MAG: AmmeMemoRadiSam system radical SAM enzyme [Methanosarcinales archaeon Met12]
MRKKAMLWAPLNDGRVKCDACAHQCTIFEGKKGICRVRENHGGKLYTLIYNTVSSINVDPIEKKPLFHFYPGSMALSLGTVSCNFGCKHCQNYAIATANVGEESTQEITLEKSVELAKQYGCQGISWTYNEPTIWFEYTYDSAKLAKKAGLYTVYVTNGYMSEDALNTIAPYLDAANVDVKAFNNEFYRQVCGAKLEPVLRTCERMKEKNIHLEVTYLIIPGHNDGPEEIRRFSEWVVGIGADTPVHFSRFHPHRQMADVTPTPVETLEEAHRIAKECGVEYVYIGNVYGHRYESTFCPKCDEILIERHGYSVINRLGAENCCPKCGFEVNVIGSNGR